MSTRLLSEEAKAILEEASEYTGWGIEDMLDVICEYVDDCDIVDFKEYIQEIMKEELEDN